MLESYCEHVWTQAYLNFIHVVMPITIREPYANRKPIWVKATETKSTTTPIATATAFARGMYYIFYKNPTEYIINRT